MLTWKICFSENKALRRSRPVALINLAVEEKVIGGDGHACSVEGVAQELADDLTLTITRPWEQSLY